MLLLAAWALQTCTTDEPASNGKVQFDFSFLFRENSGGRTQQLVTFPEGSYVLITVTNTDGTVYENKKIDLLKIGDLYTTIPLDFSPGEYDLTDFIILTQSNEALYATPKTGSPLAPLVSHPLPLHFSIATDAITNLAIEVVSTDASAPEDFGYASFGVDVHVGPEFSIAVFSSDSLANLKFTTATASVIRDGVVLHTQSVAAKTTPLFFDGEPDSTYTLEIIKDGCARYTKEFVLQELLDELDGSPLSIVLTGALTFEPAALQEGYFNFDIEGPSGSHVTVDWGDGTAAQAVTFSGSIAFLEHTYSVPGPHYASVTGDIGKLTHVKFYYDDGAINKVSLLQLKDLELFAMGFTHSPAQIDVSQNRKLRVLDCSHSDLTSLDISQNRYIKTLSILRDDFSAAAVDKVINDLYDAVTANEIYDGEFALYDENNEPIGPPSEAALTKLRSIQNGYGWSILPEIP